jgi:transcription-repair coupling factor (superfamily II helicase)
MSEQRLEQVMIDFWERRADVLVCTTIVEAGLDISTANTLLIERSDLLGLSQLHQLRGRVGRGRERGYAYFLYPPEKPSPRPPTTGSAPSPRTATWVQEWPLP